LGRMSGKTPGLPFHVTLYMDVDEIFLEKKLAYNACMV
jgi:hypothetical protein